MSKHTLLDFNFIYSAWCKTAYVNMMKEGENLRLFWTKWLEEISNYVNPSSTHLFFCPWSWNWKMSAFKRQLVTKYYWRDPLFTGGRVNTTFQVKPNQLCPVASCKCSEASEPGVFEQQKGCCWLMTLQRYLVSTDFFRFLLRVCNINIW